MERKLNQYIKPGKVYKDQPIDPIKIESATVTFSASETDKIKEALDSLVDDIIRQENLMDLTGKEVTVIEPVKAEICQISDKFNLKAYEVLGIVISKE